MPLLGSRFDPEKDLLDLTGKVVFVSGANTGIGFTAAKHLARKGAKVYVGARTEEKGKDAIERLHTEGIGSGEVIYHQCEASTPEQMRTAALEFMKREERLDILVNNAGCTHDHEGPIVQDGITRMMMVNHIGVFVLTNTLLPLLERTAKKPDADVRIIAVSSVGHNLGVAKNPNIRFGLDDFKKTYEDHMLPYSRRYWVSKLALTLFSNALQRRVSPNIICIALHPGVLFAKNPDKGCYTTLFAAASPKVKAEPEKYKGKYLTPVGVIKAPNPNALKLELQDELWETTEKYLTDVGIKL